MIGSPNNIMLNKKIKNLTDKIREADDALDDVYRQLKEANVVKDDLNKIIQKLQIEINEERKKNKILEQQITSEQLHPILEIKTKQNKNKEIEHPSVQRNKILLEEQKLLLNNMNILTNEVVALKRLIHEYEEISQYQTKKETPSNSETDKLNLDLATELKFTVFQNTIDKLQIENLKLQDVIKDLENNYFYATKSNSCCCIC